MTIDLTPYAPDGGPPSFNLADAKEALGYLIDHQPKDSQSASKWALYSVGARYLASSLARIDHLFASLGECELARQETQRRLDAALERTMVELLNPDDMDENSTPLVWLSNGVYAARDQDPNEWAAVSIGDMRAVDRYANGILGELGEAQRRLSNMPPSGPEDMDMLRRMLPEIAAHMNAGELDASKGNPPHETLRVWHDFLVDYTAPTTGDEVYVLTRQLMDYPPMVIGRYGTRREASAALRRYFAHRDWDASAVPFEFAKVGRETIKVVTVRANDEPEVPISHRTETDPDRTSISTVDSSEHILMNDDASDIEQNRADRAIQDPTPGVSGPFDPSPSLGCPVCGGGREVHTKTEVVVDGRRQVTFQCPSGTEPVDAADEDAADWLAAVSPQQPVTGPMSMSFERDPEAPLFFADDADPLAAWEWLQGRRIAAGLKPLPDLVAQESSPMMITVNVAAPEGGVTAGDVIEHVRRESVANDLFSRPWVGTVRSPAADGGETVRLIASDPSAEEWSWPELGTNEPTKVRVYGPPIDPATARVVVEHLRSRADAQFAEDQRVCARVRAEMSDEVGSSEWLDDDDDPRLGIPLTNTGRGWFARRFGRKS